MGKLDWIDRCIMIGRCKISQLLIANDSVLLATSESVLSGDAVVSGRRSADVHEQDGEDLGLKCLRLCPSDMHSFSVDREL